MRWGWLALVITTLGAAADTKVVVSAVIARGEATAPEADAVGRALTGAFSKLDGLQVTKVNSAAGLADRHAAYSIGELAPQIAAATGADWVVFAALAKEASTVLCLSAYGRADGVVRLFEPATLPSREPDRREAVAVAASLAWQRWQAANGTVIGAAPDALCGIQLAQSPGNGPGPYRIAVQPPVMPVEATAERIAPPPISVAMGELVRTEAATAWFKISEGEPPEPGTVVVVAPAAALPAPSPGRGSVLASRPRCAEVLGGGQLLGVTPIWLPDAAIMDRPLEMRHPGTLPWRRLATPEELAYGLIAADLSEATPGPLGPTTSVMPRGSRLRVESVPAGGEVRLDGQPKGLTPLDIEGVIGRPVVTIHKDGFQVWRAQVVASGPLTLRAELVSAFGQLEVTSQPTGAVVYVDGQQQGVTPLGLSGVPVGVHELRVVAKGNDTRTRKVMIEPAGVTRTEFRFTGPAPVEGRGPSPELDAPPPIVAPVEGGGPAPDLGVPPDTTPPVAKPNVNPPAPQPQARPPKLEPRVEPVKPPVTIPPPEASIGAVEPGVAHSSSSGGLPAVGRPEDIGATAPQLPAAAPLRAEPVAAPVRAAPRPDPKLEPKPYQPADPAPQADAQPALRTPRQRDPNAFKAGPMLWQMKLDSLGGRLNLVAAAYEDGVVFSITLAPGRTYLTGPAEKGFKLVYPGSNQTEGWAFALDDVPEIDAIRLEPDKSRGGALAILIDLATGVEAKIHPSSSLERARIVCRHPASAAGPVEVAER